MKVEYQTKENDQLQGFGSRLAAARTERGLTQAQLAQRCHLQRQQISYFEQGQRHPSLDQWLRIAGALNVPLQWFLTGTDRPQTTSRALAIELRRLGLVDLWVEEALVPGAFRRPEEVVVLAVTGEEPEARIVEGIPAVLAWNRWRSILLRAYGKTLGARTLYRLAWLAEIVLAVDRTGGFPGGCPGRQDLAAFVQRIKQPSSNYWDSLGRPGSQSPNSPIWKRWRINYAADLTTFRQRAKTLLTLRGAENPRKSERGV